MQGLQDLIVFADGGARLQAPCNTLPAMELALRQGAGGLKLDIQLTRDGIPVASRGEIFLGDSESSRPVWSLTSDELAEIDVGARFSLRFRGTRVPSLDEILASFGSDTRYLLELHPNGHRLPHLASLMASGAAAMVWKKIVDPLAAAVVRLIHFHQLSGQIVLASSNPFLLESLSRHDPGLRRAWQPKPGQFRLPDQASRASEWHELVLDPREVRLHDIRKLGQAGIPLTVGPVSDPAQALELQSLGLGGIITDEPWKVTKALSHYPVSLCRA